MSSFLCFIKLIDTKEMTFKAFWKAKLVIISFCMGAWERGIKLIHNMHQPREDPD
jgi:hypothetical protein